MSDIDIKGMKFLRVRRLSDGDIEDDSFEQQTMTTDHCAARFQIEVVGTEDFADCSATQGKQVQPLLDIIQKVVNGKLVIHGFLLDAYSRWARSDVDEAVLYAACREANLLILTDKEGLMMGPGTWAKRGSSTDQNEGYARDVGRHVSRVVIKMILDGTIPPTTIFPWGIDREYYDRNGVAKFRVRRMQDGRKAVLDPNPPYAVRYYLPAKQARLQLLDDGDSFKMVPGDEELQSAAKGFFCDFYKERTAAYAIVADLNRRGVPSYRGGRWRTSNLLKILHNPIWIGLSRGFAVTSGRHCERDKGGPNIFPISKRPGFKKNKNRRKVMPAFNKPSSMWITAVQPKMQTFLDEDVHKLVEAQWELTMKNNGRTMNRRGEDRNLPPKSRYFLSKLIKIKGTNVSMVGSDGPTRGDDALRYYVTSRTQTAPIAGAPSERVRADTVEEQVKGIIRSVLQCFEPQASKIVQYIEEKKRELFGKTDSVVPLRAEKSELERWYKTTYSVAGTRGRELLADEAHGVEARLQQIDLQILDAGAAGPDFLECATGEIVESIRGQFAELEGFLDKQLYDALWRLAGSLCPTMTFEPASRVMDIDVALPTWAMSQRPLLLNYVGTGRTCAGQSSSRTNIRNITLAEFSCQFGPQRCLPCLTCRRFDRKAA